MHYEKKNGAFAKSVEPDNAASHQGQRYLPCFSAICHVKHILDNGGHY